MLKFKVKHSRFSKIFTKHFLISNSKARIPILKISLVYVLIAATTAHPYVTFTSMSISPNPVVLPGDITVGVQGTVHHNFGSNVNMSVRMDKQLLGMWTMVPCANNVGSW